nr:hypothetical protein [Tanacetum cinerariifolium]
EASEDDDGVLDKLSLELSLCALILSPPSSVPFEVIKISDRIMLVRLVIEEETINVISAYAPQVGLGEAEKKSFWDSLDDLSVHEGFGYGVRNEGGRTILEFAAAHDLVVVNSFFKKKDAHLITFYSGDHDTHIDYMLVRKRDLRLCKDCKVFPGRKESWWISDEVQDKVKAKQTRFKELISMRGKNEAYRRAAEERYKEAKRKAKKAVVRAKEKAYEDLYKRLDSKEGENDIYGIAKAKDRRKRT